MTGKGMTMLTRPPAHNYARKDKGVLQNDNTPCFARNSQIKII
jgi:hypothetical protein